MNLLRTPYVWLVALLAAVAPLAARAAEPKPVAVISVASVEETLADIGYFTAVTGMEDIGKTIRLFGNALTSGMDKKRSGAYVVPLAGEFPAIAFIPVTDLKQLLGIHKEYLGEPSDEGDGVLKIGLARSAFVKEQNGWAFIAESKDHLVDLPADPAALLGDLPKRYNLAGKILVQNIPQEFRQMALDEIKFGLERGLDAPALEGRDLDRDSIEKAARASLEQLQRYLDEAQELSIGWTIDAATHRTYLDINVIAREGTKLAAELSAQASAKTNFAGMKLPEASVTLNIASQMSPAEMAQVRAMIGGMRDQWMKRIEDDPNLPADRRGPAKELLGQLLDQLDKSIATGKVDGGAALVLEPEAIHLVAGAASADGAGIEQLLKRIAELAKNEPNLPDIKFNAAAHGGVQLHRLTAPIPAHEVEARDFLGEKLNIVVGTGPKAVYLAAGKNAEALLKSAIDRSAAAPGKSVPPFEMQIAVLPLLKFAASVDENPVLPGLIAALERNGSDKVTITSQAIPRGSSIRIEVQEGLLRLIGIAIERLGPRLGDAL